MRILLVCIFLVIGAVLFWTKGYHSLDPKTNIEMVRELYDEVNNTLPSVVSSQKHTAIIRKRLECYEKNYDYTKRIRTCNNAYVKALVEQARKDIQSHPDMGNFVKNVNICPVMYSMCVGQTGNNVDRCIVFEKQCIDHMLDKFWRGGASYIQKQYRFQ